VCVSRLSELADAIRAAADVADVIELRLDYLTEVDLSRAGEAIASVLKTVDQQIILTLRPAEYGGARAISAQDRLYFRSQNSGYLKSDRDDLWDLELDLALLLQKRAGEGNDIVGMNLCDWDRTICSYHDFVGVPADLEKIYESMAQTESRILKLAVHADDALDCLPIFRLLDRAQREGREMIAIAMGEAGAMTRILGPSRGSFLTFAALDEEKGTAPGQLTARELRDIYRIDRIDRHSRVLGVVGRPVSHSISPHIHNAAFAAADLNAVFIPFDAGDVIGFVRRMVHPKTRELDWQLSGLSVTAPHKSMVMQCLEWIDVAAREIGAVNTIVVQDNELHGFNTDAAGFMAPLRAAMPAIAGARCAVVGAGGAARAVIWALKQEGADVTVLARDTTKAEFLSKTFGVKYQELSPRGFAGYDLLVNATPLGTHGQLQNEAILNSDQLCGVRLAYDLVYNPSETMFLSQARAAGCETIAGFEMLIAQAVEQFKLWTGKQPKVDVMRAAAKRRLGIE
jgi:3-dehydroquinate dehydratase/shikimate dehydrogenase